MLDVLLRWNRWGGAKLGGGITRNITHKLQPFLESTEVVVLIGPRRAGKTTVLFQVMDQLEQVGVPAAAMLHLNFEEPALAPDLKLELLDRIYKTYREEIYPDGKAYLFLDEIQNVPQWERWVRARNETEDIKIFVTGSSSQLMSRELGTLLTGRHVAFQVLPLSFQEFLRFKSIMLPVTFKAFAAPATIQNALNQYLRWGGFPEVVLADDEIRKELLLKQYFDDVLFKDVVIRHRIRDATTLRNLAVFLLTQTASLISLQRIAKMFGVSLELASSYCQYLQEAFMVDFVSFYSAKVAERTRNPQKVYAIDLGLRRIASMTHSEDKGRLIETAVYHVLQNQMHDGIFYWKGKGEVDFLMRRGNTITHLIQVVYEGLENANVQSREKNALIEASKLFEQAKQNIVSVAASNQENFSQEKSIELIPLWRYLLVQPMREENV